MEAVAISVAKSVLNSVVQTATTAITDEIGLLLGVQQELFFIKEELEMMRAFLRSASADNVKGEIVTTWVKQVQELAFDVEDCLQEASLMKKSCLPAMCLVKQNRIARKIQVLKTRIEDVSKRNLRYNLIEKENCVTKCDESTTTRLIANAEGLVVGLEEPKRKLVELILDASADTEQRIISVVGMGGVGKTILVRNIYGCQALRDEFKCFAWVTILHPFNTEEFIESLAKQIPFVTREVDNKGGTMNGDNRRQEPKKSIKEKMEEKVTRYLKDKNYLIVLDDLSSMSEWDKIKHVLPTGNGSRIVVTTRLRPLAESVRSSEKYMYEIEELSEKDAFDLFYKAVYKTPNYDLVINDGAKKDDPPQESKCNMKNSLSRTGIMGQDSEVQKQCTAITITKDMETQAGLIIGSCGRLPLAIVTIGSYLATKPKTSDEWKEMHYHLSSELVNNPDLGVVKTVLTSSYNGMPYHLKPCLLYLSVFHNHEEIRRSRVIRRWIADGYVMKSRKKTAEEVAKGYFCDLMGRSLIQPSQMSTIINGDVKRYNIHGMLYELILAKAVEDNILSVLEDENLVTMTDKVRHLVIAGAQCKEDKVLARLKLSHMRSLSIFGEVRDHLRYPRMKLLRVLDLEGTLNLDNRDLWSIGELRHLKYLGLRGTRITKLPESLGKLIELETLDMRNTAVVQLPAGLTKLRKLSYLRTGFDYYHNPEMMVMGLADHMLKWIFSIVIGAASMDIPVIKLLATVLCLLCCYGPLTCLQCLGIDQQTQNFGSFGVRAPRGIAKLRSLNIVGMVDIGQSKCAAREMQNLTKLRKLAVTGFSKKNAKTLAKVIDGLKHLRSLVLSAADDEGLSFCLESISSPPKYLQSLKLYSTLGKFPGWISSLENLVKMQLRNTKLERGGIKIIQKLHNLMIIYILENSVEENELSFGKDTFQMLQVMVIEGIQQMKLVSIEGTAMRRLVQLKIKKCPQMQGLSGLEFIENLREVMLVGYNRNNFPQEIFVKNVEKEISRHPNKPSLRVFKHEPVL